MKRTIVIFLVVLLSLICSSNYVSASAYNIKELTPPVKAALDGRKSRHGELQALKSKGIVGENNKGYVEVLTDGQGGHDIVAAENRDRKVIYEAIVEQNNLGAGALQTVEKVFAEERRDRALSGEMIQTEDGSWTAKP